MMIRPRFCSGANTALRVPTTISAFPCWIIRHCKSRSVLLSAECCTARRLPKVDLSRRIICGVRLISGTRTSARRPSSSVRWISRRNTMVLPLPVTPCSSAAWGLASSRFGRRSLKTCCCSGDSSNGCGSNGMAANRSMALSCSAAVSTPFLTRPSSVAREIPTSSSCRAVSGPFCSAATAASWRGPGFGFSGSSPASVYRRSVERVRRPCMTCLPSTTAGRYCAPYGMTALTASNQVQKVRSFKKCTSSRRSGVRRASSGAAS